MARLCPGGYPPAHTGRISQAALSQTLGVSIWQLHNPHRTCKHGSRHAHGGVGFVNCDGARLGFLVLLAGPVLVAAVAAPVLSPHDPTKHKNPELHVAAARLA